LLVKLINISTPGSLILIVLTTKHVNSSHPKGLPFT